MEHRHGRWMHSGQEEPHQRMPNLAENVGGRLSFSTMTLDSWTATFAFPLKPGTVSSAERISI